MNGKGRDARSTIVDDAEGRFERGIRTLEHLLPGAAERAFATSDIAPDFGRLTVEFAFGEIISRPGLDLRSREIATIAALTVLGRLDRLRSHLQMGRNIGLSQSELVEVLLQMAVYGGWPAAHDALHVAQEVFAEEAPRGSDKSAEATEQPPHNDSAEQPPRNDSTGLAAARHVEGGS